MVLMDAFKNFPDYRLRFGKFVFVLFNAWPRPFGATGDQNLVVAFRVECDQAIRHDQNFAGAAVVVFKANHFGVRPIVLETQDVSHVGATPRIDGLVIIANDTQVPVTQSQVTSNPVLAAVGVLILVDKHVVILGSLLVTDGWMLVKQGLGV